VRVFSLNCQTDCDVTGCKEPATGLFGDLTLCDSHIKEYQKMPMSAEDRQMWAEINNSRQGIHPGDFEDEEPWLEEEYDDSYITTEVR
jgi:hypothetical protein